MESGKHRESEWTRTFIAIFILTGLLCVYAGYTLLVSLSAVIFFAGIKFLADPVVIIQTVSLSLVLYICISFFRSKKIGWYGLGGLSVIGVLINLLILASLIFVNLFKDTLLKNLNLPQLGINSNLIWVIVILVFSGSMLALLFSADVTEAFDFGIKTKGKRILAISALAIAMLTVYFGTPFIFLA